MNLGKRQLCFASVRARQGGGKGSMTYVVFARSTPEALQAIRKERGPEWTVQFLPEFIAPRDIIERLGLTDGRARRLEPELHQRSS
jgi:hypothetical protein